MQLVHLTLGWILVIVTLGLAAFWVPPSEATIGESYLIFFFHFPSAVNCLNLFLLAGIFGFLYLVSRKPKWDFVTTSGVEVGLLATTVTLVTGSIWARAAWGLWWDVREPRMMTVAVMWLTYAGFCALRATTEEPVKRARFSAVFAVLAAVNVPIVYYSIKVLGQRHHPDQVVMGETSMLVTRWFGAFAFLVLYTALWRLRYGVHKSTHAERELEARFTDAGI